MTATDTRLRPNSWEWWNRAFLDVALAALAIVASITLYNEVLRGQNPTGFGVILLIVNGGSLAFRRLWPLAVLAVMLITSVMYTLLLDLPVYMLGPGILVAVYTVASATERRKSLLALLVVELAMIVLILVGPSFPGYGSMALFALVIGAAWFLGDVVRRWRTAAMQHEQRAAELAAAREELALRAVSEERLRIARELHDVVAHSMTVVALQAGSGRLAGRQDPEAAQRALETIEKSSREALADMRRLVGVLREGDDSLTQPAPGLDDIDRLVEEIARAGVTVGVSSSGPLDRVPPGMALAAYRVAQEALTNVVRHAGVDKAELTLEASDGALVLVVGNGPPTRPVEPIEGGGHGISGMEERASLYGGSLNAGSTDDGGYRVEARFPFDQDVE
ncbi:MAG TPA: sensor histidine kinase [Acidimicrobiia bacterium]|nr:sensor histidine kinase [Acidimicrobiia bacterium]